MQPNLSTDTDVVAMKPQVNKLTEFARTLKIVTAEQFNDAANYLKSIKGLLKGIEDARTRITKPLNDALRQVNQQAKDASAPLEAAETQIKRSVLAYSAELERLRRDEQRRADEEARREREKLEAQAAKAAASGKVEKAAQLEQRAATVVAPVINMEAPKVTGISTREVWKFEVMNAAIVPREYLIVDETKVRKVVSALKGDTNIPGVRVYPEKNLAAGAA
jgi:DNA repair exonuclease SbcCD ATPase subunit